MELHDLLGSAWITNPTRSDVLVEALGSGWVVPHCAYSTTCREHSSSQQRLSSSPPVPVLYLDMCRVPQSDGVGGSWRELVTKALVTGFHWLSSKKQQLQHSPITTCEAGGVLIVCVDLRFVSSVNTSVLLRKRVLDDVVRILQWMRATSTVFSQYQVMTAFVCGNGDHLARPCLASTSQYLGTILGSSSKEMALNKREKSQRDTRVVSEAEAVAWLPELEAVLNDDGSMFLSWWAAATAAQPVSSSAAVPCTVISIAETRRSSSRHQHVDEPCSSEMVEGESAACERSPHESGTTMLPSPSPARSHRSKSTGHSPRRSVAEMLTRNESETRLVLSEEEEETFARHFLQQRALEMALLHCELVPPRVALYFHDTLHAEDAEGHDRFEMVLDESSARRVLVDNFMESVEAIEAFLIHRQQLERKEVVDRSYICSQQTRMWECTTEECRPMMQQINCDVASAIAAAARDAAAAAAVVEDDALDNIPLFATLGCLSGDLDDSLTNDLDASTSHDGEMRRELSRVMTTTAFADMCAQTDASLEPAPRLSRLSLSLRRSLGRESSMDGYASAGRKSIERTVVSTHVSWKDSRIEDSPPKIGASQVALRQTEDF